MNLINIIKFTNVTKKARREAMKCNDALDFERFLMASNVRRNFLENESMETLNQLADEIAEIDNFFVEERRDARLAAFRGEDEKESVIDFILDSYSMSADVKAYMDLYRANLDYLEDLSILALAGKDIRKFCIPKDAENIKVVVANALGLL